FMTCRGSSRIDGARCPGRAEGTRRGTSKGAEGVGPGGSPVVCWLAGAGPRTERPDDARHCRGIRKGPSRLERRGRERPRTYALHRFVRAGELDRPVQLLEKLLYDEEFWVQRAVGTWLRECWKQDRRRTEAFLRKHARGLPRIIVSVATERAPKSFRDELRRKR